MAPTSVVKTKTKKLTTKIKSKDEALGNSNKTAKSSGSKDKKSADGLSKSSAVVKSAVVEEKRDGRKNKEENISKKKPGSRRTLISPSDALAKDAEAKTLESLTIEKSEKSKTSKRNNTPKKADEDIQTVVSVEKSEKSKTSKRNNTSKKANEKTQTVVSPVKSSRKATTRTEAASKSKSTIKDDSNSTSKDLIDGKSGESKSVNATSESAKSTRIKQSKPSSNDALASSAKSKKNLKSLSDSLNTAEIEKSPSIEQNNAANEDDEILLGGFSSQSDSSDEEDGVDDVQIDVGKLPTVAKDDATVKKKLEKAKRVPTQDRGVLYLGRIPHGFYEDEMKAYFSQFGDVTRLRISRNKKTGRSKHYGFIEFESSAVAQVVAETMDNYLLLGHILRCKVVPKEEVHPELWIGSNRKYRRVPHDRIVRLQQNKTRTEEEQEKVEKRLLRRQDEKKRKLKAAGIDYDFDPAAYKKSKAAEADE